MLASRRKKWTEAEERTLIDKYGEMVSEGTLMKMKTREKKFKPIAYHVNSMHYVRDPITYPWQWTWKDVSTKVQNMRHQYSLVKQKVKKPESEDFDWLEGLTHWSNFLRYKEVFGDIALVFNGNGSMVITNENNENGDAGFASIVGFEQMSHSGNGDFTAGIDEGENGVLGLGFEYDGDENYHDMNDNGGFVYETTEPNGSNPRKRRKMLKGFEKKTCAFLANQLGKLKEMEARFAQHEVLREREREKRENLRLEYEKERERKREERENEREEKEKARENLRKQRLLELEAMKREREEREERRREENLIYEREWEERMNIRRLEWKNKIDETLSQHRVEMGQIQTRILHEQQNLTNHLLGVVAQWTGHQTGIPDHTGASAHYFSQMMQNLQHGNDDDHARVDEDTQDDQFIVDG